MAEFSRIFADLEIPHHVDGGGVFAARPLDSRGVFRLGRDSAGRPALLVTVTGQVSLGAPVELRNIDFHPARPCRVRTEHGEERLTLAVVRCTSDDAGLQRYFLDVLDVAIASLPAIPSASDLSSTVQHLIELFSALEQPPRATVQGLWCELLLLAGARRVRQAVVAWHRDPADVHDFSAGTQRVEVKSTIGPLRAHHFSLQQLVPPEGVVVASFVLDAGGAGTSIADLWEELTARQDLTDEHRRRVAGTIAGSLGTDWRRARQVAFDRDRALARMRLYCAESIPKVDPELPLGVRDVRFSSELTDTPSKTMPSLVTQGGLFAALWG
ncbi:MAG: PD-(D/E)XK motif protein [Nannocystaceae bacterium]